MYRYWLSYKVSIWGRQFFQCIFPRSKIYKLFFSLFCCPNDGFYQRSRRVPRLTDWIRRAVNAWGMDIGSEKLVSFSDH